MDWSDSLSDSQWRSAAVSQFAADRGQFRPDQAWILSPYDTWEANPHYMGPVQPHPESGDPSVPFTFEQALRIAKVMACANERSVRIVRDRDGFDTVLEAA